MGYEYTFSGFLDLPEGCPLRPGEVPQAFPEVAEKFYRTGFRSGDNPRRLHFFSETWVRGEQRRAVRELFERTKGSGAAWFEGEDGERWLLLAGGGRVRESRSTVTLYLDEEGAVMNPEDLPGAGG